MSKSASFDQLKRGIVNDGPTAQRVSDVSKLLPAVLLNEDHRVQSAYNIWLAAHGDSLHDDVRLMALFVDEYQTLASAPNVVWAIHGADKLVIDMQALAALTRDLGLARYRWLPKMLFFEFARVALHIASPVPFNFGVPAGTSWAGDGKRPKTDMSGLYSTGPESSRLEDLPRNVFWFYLCEIKLPPISKRQLATELGFDRGNIQKAIVRVRRLLDAIDKPMPSNETRPA